VQIVIHRRHVTWDTHGHDEVNLVQPVAELREPQDILGNRRTPLAGLQIDRERAI
jgi:hypothetical protein